MKIIRDGYTLRKMIRLSVADFKKLTEVSQATGVNASEIIRQAIRAL